MARRLAALVPFYEYDEARFFRSDDAPADVAGSAAAGFARLAELYREALSPRRSGATAEVADGDLRPAVHRRLPRAVPVQPHRARST